MKKIAILGSTGSIGTQTLEVVRNNPELQVVALAAGKSVEQMEQQIREFHPLIAGMWSEEAAADLRSRVADLPVKVVTGMDGLLEIAVMPEAQVLVTAIVGMIGIRPTIAAIEAGKDIALANKETLVTAGHIIMPLAAKMGVKILPVDSEHSAIFQSLNGEPKGRIEKILLTASGGPRESASLASRSRALAASTFPAFSRSRAAAFATVRLNRPASTRASSLPARRAATKIVSYSIFIPDIGNRSESAV